MRALVEGVTVGPQIEAAQLAALKAAGVAAVINNRPDGEAPGQPANAALEAEAEALGLRWVFVPVIGGSVSEADIAAMRAAIDDAAGPVHAFCRSGSRSASLWALAEAGRRPVGEIVEAGAGAGYDLSGLAPTLNALAARGGDAA